MPFAVAVSGVNLSNYWQTLSQRGWGSPCSGQRATVRLSQAAVSVDVRLAELVGLIMRANERDGYGYRAADTGAYNCRRVAGTRSWSWHAWALAIDENWQTNPYTAPLRTDKPEWLVRRWNRYGFAWGGHYSGRKDAMHFEFMGTPAQAQAALELARRELVPTASDDQIRRDQADLTDTGFPCVVDGIWGEESAQQARNFQAAAGLVADGIVGPATRAKLAMVPSWQGHFVSDGGYPDLRWQQELKAHGWQIETDGAWGPHSTSILAQFQEERGLIRRDGVRDSQAWTALFTVPN